MRTVYCSSLVQSAVNCRLQEVLEVEKERPDFRWFSHRYGNIDSVIVCDSGAVCWSHVHAARVISHRLLLYTVRAYFCLCVCVCVCVCVSVCVCVCVSLCVCVCVCVYVLSLIHI